MTRSRCLDVHWEAMDCGHQNGINFYISIEYVNLPYRLPGPLSGITLSLKQMNVIFLGSFY